MTPDHIADSEDDCCADLPAARLSALGPLVAAGYRFELSHRDFTIHHLASGKWLRLETNRGPVPSNHKPAWKLDWILRQAEHFPNLHATMVPSDHGRMVTAAELVNLLTAATPPVADGLVEPPFPVPTVGQVFAYAYPENPNYSYRYPYSAYFRNLGDDVTAILAIATTLAWRGGEALERDLRADMVAHGWDGADVRHALKLVAARTGRNVQCDPRDRLWLMRRWWHEREDEAIERVLPPPITINQLPPMKRKRPTERGN